MSDLSQTIVAKSDQMNSDDLMGATKTIKVTKVSLLGGDQPIAINYEGDNGKPWKPCKSMRRVLVQLWGSDGSAYVGRSLTLYRDGKVTFGGMEVGGIRISHMSNIPAEITIALTASRMNKKPFTVKPLSAEPAIAIEAALSAAGQDAAAQGVTKYIAWRNGLTPEQKEQMKPMNRIWSDVAKKYDAANADEEIP